MKWERGSVIPALAVVMGGGLLALFLAIEVGRYGSSHRQVGFAADVGAEAGAAMVDSARLSEGLFPSAEEAVAVAEAAAIAARPNPLRNVVARIEGGRVCVRVTQPFTPWLLSILEVRTVEISRHACAGPRQG